MIARNQNFGIERFVEEQMFEEDVRAVLSMMRPHRQERLMGWNEYRTGGAHFRATISWDQEFELPAESSPENRPAGLSIPNLPEVLETILVGSVKAEEDLSAAEEFAIYRQVVLDLLKRLEEARSCYE